MKKYTKKLIKVCGTLFDLTIMTALSLGISFVLGVILISFFMDVGAGSKYILSIVFSLCFTLGSYHKGLPKLRWFYVIHVVSLYLLLIIALRLVMNKYAIAIYSGKDYAYVYTVTASVLVGVLLGRLFNPFLKRENIGAQNKKETKARLDG